MNRHITGEHPRGTIRWNVVLWIVVLPGLTGICCSSNVSGNDQDVEVHDVSKPEETTLETPWGDLTDAAVNPAETREPDGYDEIRIPETRPGVEDEECRYWHCSAVGRYRCVDGQIQTGHSGPVPCWVPYNEDCLFGGLAIPCESGECGETGVCSDDEAFLAALFPSGEEMKEGKVAFFVNEPLVYLATRDGDEEVMVFERRGAWVSTSQVEGTAAVTHAIYSSDNAVVTVEGTRLEFDEVELYAVGYREESDRRWGCSGHLVAHLSGGGEVVVAWRPKKGKRYYECTGGQYYPGHGGLEPVDYVVVWQLPERPEEGL